MNEGLRILIFELFLISERHFNLKSKSMKYIRNILLFAGVLFILACEEKENPVLTVTEPVQISFPIEGTEYLITEEILDSELTVIMTPPVFNYFVAPPTYHIELDIAGNDFSEAVTLTTTTSDTVEIQYSELSETLIENYGLCDSATADFIIRTVAYIGDYYNAISAPIEITITSYIDTANIVPEPDTIYLVGDATTAGWNNAGGLPIINDGTGTIYTITTTLTSGGMKILRTLGAWAPQWGTDGNGTSTGGPLIYRPDEATPDPATIPSPGNGTYRIDVDIENLTYTITGV